MARLNQRAARDLDQSRRLIARLIHSPMIIEPRAKENRPLKPKRIEDRGLKSRFQSSIFDPRSTIVVSISGCGASCPSAGHAVLSGDVRKFAPRASKEATHQRSCL